MSLNHKANVSWEQLSNGCLFWICRNFSAFVQRSVSRVFDLQCVSTPESPAIDAAALRGLPLKAMVRNSVAAFNIRRLTRR